MTAAAPSHDAPRPSAPGTGLGIGGLVCAVLGLCVPGLGLVGIVLGIIVLARAHTAGRGLAVASIIVGAISLVVNLLLLLALLLPALGQARNAAEQLRSAVSMGSIAREIIQADFESEADSAVSFDLEARFNLDPAVWAPPADAPQGVGTAYLLVVVASRDSLTSLMPHIPILIENPRVFDRRTLNAAYADGSTKSLTRDDVERIIDGERVEVYNTDGTRWTP